MFAGVTPPAIVSSASLRARKAFFFDVHELSLLFSLVAHHTSRDEHAHTPRPVFVLNSRSHPSNSHLHWHFEGPGSKGPLSIPSTLAGTSESEDSAQIIWFVYLLVCTGPTRSRVKEPTTHLTHFCIHDSAYPLTHKNGVYRRPTLRACMDVCP